MMKRSGPWIWAIFACARLTLRRIFSVKRRWFIAGLMLLPPLLAMGISVSRTAPLPEDVFFWISFQFTLFLLLILMTLVVGIALTSGEIEDGTIGYLFLGTLPRWLVLLIDLAVATLTVTILLTVVLILTLMAAGVGGGMPQALQHPELLARYALIAGTGVLTYLSFFFFCGYAFRRPIAVSVVITFLWEILFTFMPAKIAAYTVTNNLRALILHLILGGEPHKAYRYARNFDFPDYSQAAMFLSVLIAFFTIASLVAVMNRSLVGREAAP